MSALVFLDTETTGLDPEIHDAWEVAWAVDDGPIQSTFLSHAVSSADPKALELNGYFRRFVPAVWPEDIISESALRAVLAGSTIVGSNPAFDTAFLRARWHCAPWHHRLLDVSAFAMGVLGWDRPRGLADVASHLVSAGYEIAQPDHTAAKDVEVLRDCFEALRSIQKSRVVKFG